MWKWTKKNELVIYDFMSCPTIERYLLGHSRFTVLPHYEFLVNTGFYMLNPDVIELIPENQFYHITHLIEEAKNRGRKVGVYPIDDDAWVDVGQWTEYQIAVERL